MNIIPPSLCTPTEITAMFFTHNASDTARSCLMHISLSCFISSWRLSRYVEVGYTDPTSSCRTYSSSDSDKLTLHIWPIVTTQNANVRKAESPSMHFREQYAESPSMHFREQHEQHAITMPHTIVYIYKYTLRFIGIDSNVNSRNA